MEINRKNTKVYEDRFINMMLREEGNKLKEAQVKFMQQRGFTSPEFFSDISVKSHGTTLTHEHLLRHRFVDMKTRNTKNGKKRKKNHPLHNRLIFGYLNTIIHRIQFDFTDEIIQMVKAELEGENQTNF